MILEETKKSSYFDVIIIRKKIGVEFLMLYIELNKYIYEL